MEQIERYRGCLLGLAVGDALGAPFEGRPPGSFEPITDMGQAHAVGLEPGQWTDDTAMAMCLAESLIERKRFDPADQLGRYLRWFREGHLSSSGTCYGIGYTTRTAILAFERTGRPYCGSDDPNTAGNGSIMRLAPVPMMYANKPTQAIARAADSSRTTHGPVEAIDACRYLAGLIVAALNGLDKQTLLSERFCPIQGEWDKSPLAPRIADVAAGSFKHRDPPEIRGTAYVVESLEAALWAFHRSSNFRDGALMAVNLGDDADTTAAVYSQLAGAYYGERQIPSNWLTMLAKRELIETVAAKLLELAG